MELANNDFYYATLNSKVTKAVGVDGYTFQGIAARVFTTQELSTVPLLHVYNAQTVDNLYTTSTSECDLAVENGYEGPTTLAYIYPSQICGAVPFYRIYNSADTEHYYTINETERDAMVATGAWADQGITGYVLDPNPCA
ncbi:hypothetical protein B0H12DRAFT_1182323 [Mycena haematopus]|nr:hypothetical protein B0H12DRAFT_1182323 [Mycena haematopus]